MPAHCGSISVLLIMGNPWRNMPSSQEISQDHKPENSSKDTFTIIPWSWGLIKPLRPHFSKYTQGCTRYQPSLNIMGVKWWMSDTNMFNCFLWYHLLVLLSIWNFLIGEFWLNMFSKHVFSECYCVSYLHLASEAIMLAYLL